MPRHPEKLIVVAGHAAFKGPIETVPDNPAEDKHWVLQAFQHGEPSYYIEHIRKGAALLAEDEASLLMFSGGRTRREAGHWSEAATYQAVAEHYRYWTDKTTREQLMARTALELYARDSFQNLQFSLYEFYRLTGKYPNHITVVGWQFKAARFDHHRATLGIPTERVTYAGCNKPEDLAGAMKGEEKVLELFQADPTGSHSPLADKRKERNPFDEQHPYSASPPITQ